MKRMVLRAAVAALVLTLAASGCKEDESEETGSAEKASDDDGDGPASSASAAAEVPEGDFGPMVTIPAGTLKAGSRCMDVPRIRPDELEHEEMVVGEFRMDAYPYPNEPGKPAKLNVNWFEAKQLCEERGKRLCTEIEWERACKGPKNTTYMWGDGFSTKQCKGQLDHLTNQRPECKTQFGVMDMMGVALEWTASDWERGKKNGEKVVRGAREKKVSWLSARCTHSRHREPNLQYDNVGFRCCAGEPALPEVELAQKKRATIDRERSVSTNDEMVLLKAMPRDHRGITGVELGFDEVYRWHPVANEEMTIGIWEGKPRDGEPFYEVAVFKLCGARAWKAATMRGPVGRVGRPKVGINPRKISFDVSTDDRKGKVELSYWHGSVKLTQPDWVKKGNQLKVKAGVKLRLPFKKGVIVDKDRRRK
jgi:formylglycine-generating enzyme required for sulfatase activity